MPTHSTLFPARTTMEVAKQLEDLNLGNFTMIYLWDKLTFEEKQQIANALNCSLSVLALKPVAVALIESLNSTATRASTHFNFRDIALNFVNEYRAGHCGAGMPCKQPAWG